MAKMAAFIVNLKKIKMLCALEANTNAKEMPNIIPASEVTVRIARRIRDRY